MVILKKLWISEDNMDISVTIKNPFGHIKAITSKSYAHRHLICSALSDKTNFVEIQETSQDIDATVRCLNALGSNITHEKNGFRVEPITKANRNAVLDCKESGSTFRFLLPISCALGADSSFTMQPGLAKRPITPLYMQLAAKGCTFSQEGVVPFLTKGRLKSGTYELTGDVSSQYITGLLMALPLLKESSRIILSSKLESSGYVDMTIDVLSGYGIHINRIQQGFEIPDNIEYHSSGHADVEKDWSNASFFLCAGALSEQGITVEGLNVKSLQKDKMILDILSRMGAAISVNNNYVTIRKDKLSATDIDASEIPDLVPILSLMASVSRGKTVIYNAKRLRIKESDRLSSTYDMLKRLGADIKEEQDSLIITGKQMLNGGSVYSFNDHRIAMTAAIASIVSKETVIIQDAQAVNKSYPDFFKDFAEIGGITKIVSGGSNVISVR